jgi:hypothetical protein
MIVMDDLRPMFPAFGYEGVSAPHMSRLAAHGLAFKNAYVQQAVCGPSRNSFLTGRRPDSTRTWNFKSDFRRAGVDSAGRQGKDWTALPQAFKDNGYVTAGLGKIYHPNSPAHNDYPTSWSTSFSSSRPANVTCTAAGGGDPIGRVTACGAATAGSTTRVGCNFSYVSPFGQIWMPNCTKTTTADGRQWNPTVGMFAAVLTFGFQCR